MNLIAASCCAKERLWIPVGKSNEAWKPALPCCEETSPNGWTPTSSIVQSGPSSRHRARTITAAARLGAMLRSRRRRANPARGFRPRGPRPHARHRATGGDGRRSSCRSRRTGRATGCPEPTFGIAAREGGVVLPAVRFAQRSARRPYSLGRAARVRWDPQAYARQPDAFFLFRHSPGTGWNEPLYTRSCRTCGPSESRRRGGGDPASRQAAAAPRSVACSCGWIRAR